MKIAMPGPCAEWAEMLAVVSPADLSPAAQTALEAHLATCPACAAVKADYRRMDARIRALPAVRPLDGLPPALLQLWAEEDQRRHESDRVIPLWSTEDGMRTREEINVSKPAPNPQPQNRQMRRLVSGLSAIAAVVVIAIVVTALVFSHMERPSPTGTQRIPATNVPVGSQGWEAVPHLTNTSGLPVLAPSNPQVVYEAQLASADGPTSVTLQRSDNDGASWHVLALPTGITRVYTADFFVSPLNAQSVFVDFVTPCPTAQVHAIAPALAPFGGGANSCTFDYFSTDGGAHWSLMHWPVHQAGTSFPGLASLLRAQGNRLYALVNANVRNGNGFESSFVSSTDGGASWHFADQQLVAQGGCVADYAPTPTGTTVFADVVNCTSTGAAARSSLVVPAGGGGSTHIWRSDDAGVHWTLVGPFGGITALSLSLDGAGHPVLFLPPVTTYGRGVPVTQIPAEVSVDGGKTWQNAPTINGQLSTSGILGTLSDGSIIVAYRDSKTHQGHLFSWKAGDAAWHELSPGFSDAPQYLLIVPSGSGGHDTFWLVTASALGRFSVQRLTLS
jgi:hypothetical protein